MIAKKSFLPTLDQPTPAITIKRIYATQPDEERIVKALKIVVAKSEAAILEAGS